MALGKSPKNLTALQSIRKMNKKTRSHGTLEYTDFQNLDVLSHNGVEIDS
jgi:hypothetical protein